MTLEQKAVAMVTTVSRGRPVSEVQVHFDAIGKKDRDGFVGAF